MVRTYQVLWAGAAQRDLEGIVRFIAKENRGNALKIFRSIRSRAASLKKYPDRGRRPPELSRIRGLPFRELLLSPWRLIYRVEGKRVEVLACFDGRRDLEEVLYERLSRV